MSDEGFSAIISAYEPRGTERAFDLAKQLHEYVDQVVVVINSDNATESLCDHAEKWSTVYRPNRGMNLGAWSEGLGHCAEENHVICLQDECRLEDAGFVGAYKGLFERNGAAMVGESLNPKWAIPWSDLRGSGLDYALVDASGNQASRVDYYLACFKQWGIQPGNTGRHLRALVWGFSRELRQSLRSLPYGNNKEQCIAAEIGVSQFVENNLVTAVCQSSEKPFKYFSHEEWRRDGLSKI